jgi:hypothetical protein
MAEAEAVRGWLLRTLQHLETARRAANVEQVERLMADLIAVHVDLGERRVGTREEQTTYIMARSTNTPLPLLLAHGIDTNTWPPLRHLPVPAAPQQASPATERRIKDLFQAAGVCANRRPRAPRYVARYRPEDEQVFKGTPLPWALWDTHEDQAIAYHPDKDLCEYQADVASEVYENRRRQP